ncbi:MAG: PQQ-binding-like beta-propeller repeat protein [Bdellovibrionales bacterium]
MLKRLALVSLPFLVACSSMSSTPNRFVIDKRWVRDTLKEEYLGGRRMHRFSPVLTETMVITANSIDGMVAYDRQTAHRRWRLDIKDGCEGGAVISDGVLFFGAGDGQFYAVQAESGTVLWSYPLKSEGLSRPLVKGPEVFVLGGNNVVHSLNAKTGKLNWVYNRREATNISIRGGSRPALAGDLLLVGFSDGALVALKKSSGAIVWEATLNRNKRFKDVDASPVVDGDMIYVSSYDGALYALNRSDGRVMWMVDEGGYDQVLVKGKTVFHSSSTGKIMAIDKSSGKVIWSHDNPRGIATAPTLMKGVLIFGEMSGALRFLDARTGDFLGEFSPGRGVTSTASVDSKTGDVYFMSTDANLFALRVSWQKMFHNWEWE